MLGGARGPARRLYAACSGAVLRLRGPLPRLGQGCAATQARASTTAARGDVGPVDAAPDRTTHCGGLSGAMIGSDVVLRGWLSVRAPRRGLPRLASLTRAALLIPSTLVTLGTSCSRPSATRRARRRSCLSRTRCARPRATFRWKASCASEARCVPVVARPRPPVLAAECRPCRCAAGPETWPTRACGPARWSWSRPSSAC